MDGPNESSADESDRTRRHAHGRAPIRGRGRLRLLAILSLLLAAISSAGTAWWWHRQVTARRHAELTRTFQRAMAAVVQGEAPRSSDGRPAVFPDTPLGRIYDRVLLERQGSTALVGRMLARYHDEHDAWAALVTASPDGRWRSERAAGVAAIRADLDGYEASRAGLGRYLDDNAGHDEWTRAAARKLHPDRTGPAELELRAALRELCLAWSDRLAIFGRPSTDTEEDRRERQRLADRQAALTERVELALRAVTSDQDQGSAPDRR